MRCLYISHHRDHTGYAQAAIDYVLALDRVGVDVVPRPFKLNSRQGKLPPRLLELEQKSSKGCDVAIYHTLPQYADFNGRFRKNIALFASETSHFRQTVWADRLNCMDEVWAINRAQKQACLDSGVKVPIHVVPHTADMAKYERGYDQLEALRPYKDQGEFLFYAIGESVRRKNFQGLLKAFHSEFHSNEPVRLVVKTDCPGMGTEELRGNLTKLSADVRKGMKRGHEEHKEEVWLLDRLTDEGMMRLHATCDCFVLPSFGEAWCIPAFDAMAMGKTPIVPAHTGFLDYVSDKEGWLVPSREEPVFGVSEGPDDLYTGYETWGAVDLLALRRCMREAYEGKGRAKKAAQCLEKAYLFSYEEVGAAMRKLLENDHPPLAGPGSAEL